jgi:hypothetical protein
MGAAWGRRIPIVALLLGITAAELQNKAGIPVLLKKRDLLELNEIDTLGATGWTHKERSSLRGMGNRQVFISHSMEDADWARSFATALKERGVVVWFDEFEMRPGESWRDVLESGLRSSDVLVTVFDEESSSKANLFFELGAAIGMGKRVVPIVPKDIDPSVLPFDVRSRRYLIRDTPEETAEELSNTLRAA